MADPPVPQLDEVVHHLSDAASVRCAHDVDGAAGHAPADDDNRRSSCQLRHRVVAEFGPQQDQGFTPKAEQGLDDGGFGVSWCDGAEHDLISVPVGLGHDVLDQLSVKCAANIGHNADEV